MCKYQFITIIIMFNKKRIDKLEMRLRCLEDFFELKYVPPESTVDWKGYGSGEHISGYNLPWDWVEQLAGLLKEKEKEQEEGGGGRG